MKNTFKQTLSFSFNIKYLELDTNKMKIYLGTTSKFI